jgi:predicted amidophosphoribosyltransferase
MTTCATPGCGRTFLSNRRYCTQCRKALLAQGLCAHCGVRPRQSKRHYYCQECDAILAAEAEAKMGDLEVLPDPPQAKYRGQDAREKTYETKHGTWQR